VYSFQRVGGTDFGQEHHPDTGSGAILASIGIVFPQQAAVHHIDPDGGAQALQAGLRRGSPIAAGFDPAALHQKAGHRPVGKPRADFPLEDIGQYQVVARTVEGIPEEAGAVVDAVFACLCCVLETARAVQF
jgi:hypothetical protein